MTHIAFWSVSAIGLAALAANLFGFGPREYILWLFFAWIVTGFLMGVSALASGKIYIGNQVFSKEPTTGWVARMVGAVLFVSVGLLMWFFFGLLFIVGR
ncbi:MAG: hypothetical protein ACRDBH_03560 [Bosea sp. (in: a-proteobacteria)]